MSEETSRPTCPFKYTGSYVPPRYQQGPITTALNLGPLASLAGHWRGLASMPSGGPTIPNRTQLRSHPTRPSATLNLT